MGQYDEYENKLKPKSGEGNQNMKRKQQNEEWKFALSQLKKSFFCELTHRTSLELSGGLLLQETDTKARRDLPPFINTNPR